MTYLTLLRAGALVSVALTLADSLIAVQALKVLSAH